MQKYPYKYPELYAELARQGKTKRDLAKAMGITVAGLRYKQSLDTDGDFRGREIKIISEYLGVSAEKIFGQAAPC